MLFLHRTTRQLNPQFTYLQMTKLRVVEPTTDLTRVSEGIAQLEIMLNDVIKVSVGRLAFEKRCSCSG